VRSRPSPARIGLLLVGLLATACDGRAAGSPADAGLPDAAPDAGVDYCVLDESVGDPEQRELVASFVVDATGWSVSGWIEAVYCDHLNVYCV
jgi:hypothetical protein